jgi:hypothetical protein
MFKYFRRSYHLVIAIALLLASSSALAAQGLHDAKARASHHHGARHRNKTSKAQSQPATGVPQGQTQQQVYASASQVLLGDDAVEPQSGNLRSGQAEAFRFRASSSGMAGDALVYLSDGSTVNTVTVGLYGNENNHPRSLISNGTASASRAEAWSPVPIKPARIVAGKVYWLAILGEGGELHYRANSRRFCLSQTNASSTLHGMPGSWRSRPHNVGCPASTFVETASAEQSGPLEGELHEPTEGLEELAPQAATMPSIFGSPQVGQELEASSGIWSGTPTSYAYKWETCEGSAGPCSEVKGATSSNYELVPGDVGHTMRVTVTASNAGGSTQADSEATEPVTGQTQVAAPVNTQAPAISGTAEEGQTLTASEGSWTGTPASYSYQWEDCNGSGNSCAEIEGATSSSYELATADVGHTVRVLVTATNVGGSASAASQATSLVTGGSSHVSAPVNTGLPAVSGSAEEGETLTASEGSWSGSPTSYGYQWEDCNSSGASCSEIADATSSSYELASRDVGRTLRVVVTAANAGGSAKASSEATSVVVALAPSNTVLPNVTGTPQEGKTLSATEGTWTGSPTSYSYQWEDCNSSGGSCSAISGASSSSYKLDAGDVGQTVRVVVTATNAGGSGEANSEVSAVVVPVAPSNTALPKVSGSTQEGKTLTATEGSWSPSPTSYGYQWQDCSLSGGSCSEITGATSSSYKLGSGDVGHTVRVVVTATDAGGSAKASSEATATVSPLAPTNSALPVVSGTAQEGKTLSATEGSWTGKPSYSYQWEDCNSSGGACSEVSGATSSSYKLGSGDVGHTVRVVVTAANAGGSAKASSEATSVVVALAPSNTVLPKVTGTAQEGKTLSATEGSWTGSPTSYSYQWEDCNSSGGACAEVSGATSSSYKLGSGDVGHTVRVVVTATNTGGSAKASSEATATVVPPAPTNTGLPKVSGKAVEAQTLTATEGSWSGNPTSYGYQWEDCNSAGASCTSIGGAASSTYKLTSNDVGHTIRVVVTASNAGGATKASSEASAVVEAEATLTAPVNTAAPKIEGSAEEGQTLSATEGSWTDDPTSYGYQWEDCNSAGASCTSIGGAASSTYKLTSNDVGHTIRVVVTATNGVGPTNASSEPTSVVVAVVSTGPQIYVSQSGAGSQSGEGSCSSAHSLSWLNSYNNWGSGGDRVAPGTTVDLCGTLTEPVETQASGSPGKPITIMFTAGAKIAMGGNGCPGSGCINVAGNSEYVTINGGSNGQIENSERSYEKNKEEGPPTTAIEAEGCHHCTFENLNVGPMYMAEKGDVVGNAEIRGIKIRPETHTTEYITVAHDYFHDQGWAVNIEAAANTTHIYVEHNVFYHLTHGFTPGASFNGGNIGPVVFAYNHFYGDINWEDGEHDTNHVDGVHCFAGYGDYPHYNDEPDKGLYIYDNYIATEGHNVTAPVFLEGSNNHTVCGDKTSDLWVFNNVLTGTSCCGLITDDSGEPHIFNNTLIGESNNEEGCEMFNSDTEGGRELAIQAVRFKNNIVTTCKTLIDAEKQLIAPGGMGNNLWANGGSENETFVCRNPNRHEYFNDEYSQWRSCMENDEEDSIVAATAKLNLEETVGHQGEPESGSEAIGHGANLSSLCSQTPEEALCKNINGESRPSSGAWDIGAY